MITFPGKSIWGHGHIVSAVYYLTHICRQLQRYCYLQFYETEMGQLLGYADGNTWDPTDEELALYPNRTNLVFNVPSDQLLDALSPQRNSSFALICVTMKLFSSLPYLSTRYIPYMPWDRSNLLATSAIVRLGRCFARFVTEPRVSLELASPVTVYHMRTGFADFDDNALKHHPRDSSIAREWVQRT